jgi:hypothetical protein
MGDIKGLPSQQDVLEEVEKTETDETEDTEETEGDESESGKSDKSTERDSEDETEEGEEAEESDEGEEESDEEKAERSKLPKRFREEVKNLRSERKKLREELAETKKKADEKVNLPEKLQKQIEGLREAVSKEPWIDELLYKLSQGADEISVEEIEAVLKEKKAGIKPQDRELKERLKKLEASNSEQEFRSRIAEQTKEVQAKYKHFDDDDIRQVKRLAYVKSLEEGKTQESLLEFAKEYDSYLKKLKQKLLKPVASKREIKQGLRVEDGGGADGAEKKKLPPPGSAEFRKLVQSGALDHELGMDG